MFRKLLFIISLFALVGTVSAQTLQFEYNGVVYENGQTLTCHWDVDEEAYVGNVFVKNLSSETQQFLVERELIQGHEGVYNSYFCFGACLDPSVNTSGFVEINSLEAEILSIHVNTVTGEPITGTVIYKYSAYPRSNPDERIDLYVQAGDALDIAENKVTFGGAYPNPASSQVCFNFKSSSSTDVNAVVYNLLGQEVKSQLVNGEQGVIRIAVDDLQPGIYFCNFQVNNAVVKTEKFIVKK